MATINILLLLLDLIVSINCLQNGDVRLLDGSHNDVDGVLQIYLNDVWVTVCFDGINSGAVSAACRQLGYCTSDSYKMDDNFNPGSNYFISNVSCAEVLHYQDQELHLMRCSQDEVHTEPCTGVARINCKSDCLVRDTRYNGQVYIDHMDTQPQSTGILNIYLEDKYLPICFSDLTEEGLNAACRQLGYTNVNVSTKHLAPRQTTGWNISTNVLCKESSYNCFTDCFNHSNSYPQVHCRHYSFACTFDENKAASETSGAEAFCIINQKMAGSSSNNAVLVALLVFIALLIFSVLVLVLVLVVTCIILRRRGYRQINGQPPNEDQA